MVLDTAEEGSRAGVTSDHADPSAELKICMIHECHKETTANLEALGAVQVHVVTLFPVDNQIPLAVFVHGGIIKSIVNVTVPDNFRTKRNGGSKHRPGWIDFHPFIGIVQTNL